MATFSFFPSKNLGAFGDGGAIDHRRTPSSPTRARMLRFHGSQDKVTYEHVGYNSRLDEIQAAILRVLLPHLDGWADGRRAAGRHYEEAGLGDLVALPVPTGRRAEPAWHLYVVAPRRRPTRWPPRLDEAGIGTQGLLPHAGPPPAGDARRRRAAWRCRSPTSSPRRTWRSR